MRKTTGKQARFTLRAESTDNMFNNLDYLQYVCLIVDLVSKGKERKQICSHVFCHVVICLLARESIARKMPLRQCTTNEVAIQRN